MAGVADTQTIDLVALDADGVCLVVMVEERPWGSTPGQDIQLGDKINTYAGFILDGSLSRTYPSTDGKPVRIQLDCVDAPSGHFAHLTDHAAAQLAAYGIEFRVNPRERGTSHAS